MHSFSVLSLANLYHQAQYESESFFFSTTLMYLVFSILILSAVTKCRRLYFSMLFLISKKNGLETSEYLRRRNCFNYQLTIFFKNEATLLFKAKNVKKVHVFNADESS